MCVRNGGRESSAKGLSAVRDSGSAPGGRCRPTSSRNLSSSNPTLRRIMGRILGRIIVTITVLLISFIAYSIQIFVIWPWYGSVLSVPLITLLLPFK